VPVVHPRQSTGNASAGRLDAAAPLIRIGLSCGCATPSRPVTIRRDEDARTSGTLRQSYRSGRDRCRIYLRKAASAREMVLSPDRNRFYYEVIQVVEEAAEEAGEAGNPVTSLAGPMAYTIAGSGGVLLYPGRGEPLCSITRRFWASCRLLHLVPCLAVPGKGRKCLGGEPSVASCTNVCDSSLYDM
jgi:hypothetical protein